MKTWLSKTALALLACVVASGFVACKKDKIDGSTAVVSITVTPATASVAIGATSTLHAQAFAANDVAVSDAVTWTSSDAGKATVDASGVVTGVSAGQADITATVGSIHSNAATITVTAAAPHVASIAVTLDHASIATAGTANATAQATDQFGAALQDVAFTWHSSNTGVATIDGAGMATGVTAGTADITASSDDVTSTPVTLTVTATVAQSFKLLPESVKLDIGDQSSLLAITPSATPTWTSSDPAVATVDSTGEITAVAKGTATITATSGSQIATSSIRVFQSAGSHPDPSSEDLISRALTAGMITHEQALEYRVFALFGDPRLPAAYDGAPSSGANHALLGEVRTEFPGLSVSAQNTLSPFFLAPIYTESALNPQAAGANAIAFKSGTRAPDVHAQIGTGVNCNVAAGPSAYRRVSVTTADNKFTFNVFYFPAGGGLDPDLAQAGLAQRIADAALDVYAKETALFDRFPLSDAGLSCNGGDGGIDLYLTQLRNLKLAGQTNSYLHPCSNTPSFIELNLLNPIFFYGMVSPHPTDGASAIKAVLAHEFLHVLQFAMDRPERCDDDRWFDEATAEWAMDFVEPTFAVHDIGAPGLEDGILSKVSNSKRRSGDFLAQYLYSGHMRSIEKGEERNFGYADYLFFQYVARSQGNNVIQRIYDAMSGPSGKTTLEAIEIVVDTTATWPEFAKTLWNDVDQHVLDYWQHQDDYDFGLADVFANTGFLDGAPSDLQPLEIDQKAKSEETFTLLDNALERSDSGDYEIPPRSIFYEQVKFTDPTVHTVTFSNPIAGDPDNHFVKVWVVRKVDGHWQAPEDWTEQPVKAFCFDAKAERMEQMLVIVSNSEFQNQTQAPYKISLRAPMQIATTNVGCWHWEGTIGVTTHEADGPVRVESADVSFDLAKSEAAGLPDAGLSLGYLVFGTNATSIAHYSISGFSNGIGCTLSGNGNAAMIPRANGPFVDTDGGLIVNFGLPEPLHRTALGTGITEIKDVSITHVCPMGTGTDVSDQTVRWLKFPDPAATLSADGQSIKGSFTTTDAEGEHQSSWDLHAVREQ
jgi:uncharacterized protein YjdB